MVVAECSNPSFFGFLYLCAKLGTSQALRVVTRLPEFQALAPSNSLIEEGRTRSCLFFLDSTPCLVHQKQSTPVSVRHLPGREPARVTVERDLHRATHQLGIDQGVKKLISQLTIGLVEQAFAGDPDSVCVLAWL